MNDRKAFFGSEIFDGARRHKNSALLSEGGRITQIIREADIPGNYQPVDIQNGLFAPGFVDLQVNGGGGVLFNGQPDIEAIETICNAHASLGTTALMPTLITDRAEVGKLAIKAAIEAQQKKLPGFLGLHLEGPHLSRSKKGAHDPSLIRSMEEADLLTLVKAKENISNLFVTIAPEAVCNEQIKRLADAGLVLSIGHSSASFDVANGAFAAGVSAATHLFNAMSPLDHREPGIVGAVLGAGHVYAGLIADGFHVHREIISMALRAKKSPGRIFLVSDAMSPTGTDLMSFTLNKQTVRRNGGKLTLEDGTLAGADLDMGSAVRFMIDQVGVNIDEALKMASLYPAKLIGVSNLHGSFMPGAHANIIHLNSQMVVTHTWINAQLR